MIISCVHKGEKTKLTIKYLGKKKEVAACDACVNIITESNCCEVIS